MRRDSRIVQSRRWQGGELTADLGIRRRLLCYTMNLLLALATLAVAAAHQVSQHALSDFPQHQNTEFTPDSWLNKYGAQQDLSYTGPLAFSHLQYHKCLQDPSVAFDVAFFGMPFDTATSYRPGARFGPAAIRHGSRRQQESRGYTMAWGRNPYDGSVKVIDCGDVSVEFAYRLNPC